MTSYLRTPSCHDGLFPVSQALPRFVDNPYRCEAKPVIYIYCSVIYSSHVLLSISYYCLSKGNQLSEDKPDVDHLDIGGGGQRLGHADEEGGQDQQRGQVHRHQGLKEEWLEEVCGVDNH